MPRSSEVKLTCPCGTEFQGVLHSAVNVTLEPLLLYELLAGTLNTAVCPNCGRRVAPAQAFIYHDIRRGIFAYVHSSEQAAEEEREQLLATLRRNYALAVEEAERLVPPRQSKVQGTQPRVRRRSPAEDLARIDPDTPPLHIIFGTGNLITLVDSLLEPEERLGRVALSTRSQVLADRARLLSVAQRLARELECLVEVEDGPQEYVVCVYGPRSRTDALAKMLRSA
jgi:hypothetical protein